MKDTTTTTTTPKKEIRIRLAIILLITLLGCALIIYPLSWQGIAPLLDGLYHLVVNAFYFSVTGFMSLIGIVVLVAALFAMNVFFPKRRRYPKVETKTTATEKELLPPREKNTLPPEKIIAQNIYVPNKREADFYQYRKAYYQIILPMRNENKSPDEQRDEMAKQGIPNSKKTYRKIVAAGDANLLIEFKRRRKRKGKSKGQL